MSSHHRPIREWLKKPLKHRQRPRDLADETPEQSTEQPKATENSQEQLTRPAGPSRNRAYKRHRPNSGEPYSKPSACLTVQGTDDKSPIWSRSMQLFEKEQPELYELMKDRIAEFGHQSVDNWDTWLNDHQKKPEDVWFRRCKAYLPSFRAVKSVAMALSNLDHHKLAPLVTAGVFVAIELCFESVDPSARDKAMNIMLKVKGLIDKWADGEIDLQGLKGRFSEPDHNLEKIDRIEKHLEVLYLGCLKLISSIYKSGKTKRSRAASSLISEPTEWDQAYEKLNDKNSECSEWKNQVESEVRRNNADIAILDRIRIRSEDPEPEHQSVKERTGVNNPESIAGNWFLETDDFNSWLGGIRHGETEKRLFWLKGSMGTGKTTLLCRIITHFEKQPISGVRFVPYYCYASGTSKESKAPKHETIIRALCRRLAWNGDGTVAKPAKDLFNTRRNQDASFTVISTWEPLLKDLMTSSKTTIIFAIDALDECEEYNQLLRFLGTLPRTPNGPYFLLSSRPHVRVGDYFNDSIQVDAANQKAEQDMKKFITDQIDSKNNVTWAKSIFFEDGLFRRRLEEALYENAGGMFRWVEIWLGIFFPKTRKPIRQEQYARALLDELENPKRLERLDKLRGGENNDYTDNWKHELHKAYRKLWDINGEEQYKAVQTSAFQIVMGAFGSLTPQQLLEAVCLANPDYALQLDELEDLYCNFLKIDNKGRLNFEHLSAKIFVSEIENEDSNELMFSKSKCNNALAETVIKAMEQPNHPIWRDYGIDLVAWGTYAKATITVESDDDIKILKLLPDSETRSKWTETKAAIYSAHFGQYLLRCWISHCEMRKDDNQFVHRMVNLFQRARPSLEGWIFTTTYMERIPESRLHFTYWEPVLYARSALFVPSRQDETVIDISHFLFIMALNFSPFIQDPGPEPALLPDFDDDDITLPNDSGCISLHIACASGNSAMVRNLLKFQRAKMRPCTPILMAMDCYGRIPMHYACTDDVVKILLEYEMTDTPIQATDNGPLTSRLVGSTDRYHITPVDNIVRTCSDDFLEWMFKRYHLESSHSLNGILAQAINYGKEKTVGVILEIGADINCPCDDLTPLGRAARVGNVRLLEFLLDQGAILDGTSKKRQSALGTAILYRRFEAVRYLIDRGARLDIGRETALQMAVSTGLVEMAKIVLEKGVDINAEGGNTVPLLR
ncbi:hypothetical protein F4823DRAFT_559659 [Ustulina deusta]|nr:hypothetical protein F4823DRAFT_559659 [Ustulina deusta]